MARCGLHPINRGLESLKFKICSGQVQLLTVRNSSLSERRFDGSALLDRLGVRAADLTNEALAATLFVDLRLPIVPHRQTV